MEKNSAILITYDIDSKKFSYSDSAVKLFSMDKEKQDFFNDVLRHHFLSPLDNHVFIERFEEICKSSSVNELTERFSLKNLGMDLRIFSMQFISVVPQKNIIISMKDVSKDIQYLNHLTRMTEYDELTGLMNLETFKKNVENFFLLAEAIHEDTNYAIVYLDVIKFKAINDVFGKSGGDIILLHIANILKTILEDGEFACRIISDRFALFVKNNTRDMDKFIEDLLRLISQCELPVTVNCNAGIYVINDTKLPTSDMLDKAILAQSTIKGSFTQQFRTYTEEIRKQMLSEQEIVGTMTKALQEKQFVPYFQPQYDHSSGVLVGAEALVRWKHPEKGLIRPDLFIPIFEKNGFITPLDMYIFEQACRFLRKCLDEKISPVPISTNFSRYDIFQPDFVEKLESCRKKYDIPVDLVRIEITESAVFGGSENTNRIVRKLHDCGYIVEMDDFGSGYSSLNVLKDVDFDIIKLDMKFLSDDREHGRGGTVISSVVNMAKWLKLTVIAEGVETVAQADFLKSIGANWIQGYLYSKPLPEEDFLTLLKNCTKAVTFKNVAEKDADIDFWNPKSQETLLFNNFVGPAAIFQFQNEKVEIIRINHKYIKEFRMNLSENDYMHSDFLETLDATNRKIFLDTIKTAIESEDEEICETWRTLSSGCCGTDRICIRTNMRLIANAKGSYMFYAMIRNITAEKAQITQLLNSERRFMAASEQAKIYYWEYDVLTKDMHPCFRCQRDLGLPEVVHNYPEPAIEKGIFPPDYADLYREWHKNIEKGVKEQEAVIPLTKDRIPFHVHYTTEFNKSGRPIKAYGSATMLQNEPPKP